MVTRTNDFFMVEGKLSSNNHAFANFPNESIADLLLTYLLTYLLQGAESFLRS